MRMNEDEVDRIFNGGDKSPKNFASRLFNKYFSKHELVAGNVSISGYGARQKLDPIRMEYIKSHLIERNGGHLNDKEWAECKSYMAAIIYHHKKRFCGNIVFFY